MRWLAALAVLSAVTPSFATKTRHLLAFSNASGVGEIRLRYSAADARRMAGVFAELGGVPPDRSTTLTGARPDDVRRALDALGARLAAHPNEEATVVVYFSGHGSEEDLHLGGATLPVAELRRRVTALPAALRIVVIDACRTGGFAREKGFRAVEPFVIRLAPVAGPEGTVLIRSSSAGEAAHESDRLGGAVFTHYLTSALAGAGDADRDGDVTLAEAYQFAYHRTLEAASSRGGVQHPAAEFDVMTAGPLVLTTLSQADAAISLPPSVDARFLLFHRPSGALAVEVWGREDAPTTVAVPPGRYVIHRLTQGGSAAADVHVSAGAVRAVAQREFRAFSPDRLAQKGGEILVRPHEISAAGGVFVDHLAALGGALRLDYRLRLTPAWTLGVRAKVDLSARGDAAYDVRERGLGGGLFAGQRVDLDGLVFLVDGGVEARWIDQRQRRQDAARVGPAGYLTEENRGALAVGGFLTATLRVPLGERLWWDTTAAIHADGVREERGPAPRVLSALEAGVGVNF